VPLALRLAQLLPGASAAVIVGSGGPTFFERFEQSAEAADGWPHPLDRFTGRVVAGLAADTLPALGIAHALYYPFAGQAPLIPFQRLGRAAGLGADRVRRTGDRGRCSSLAATTRRRRCRPIGRATQRSCNRLADTSRG